MILWRGHCSVHGRFSAAERGTTCGPHPRRERAGAPRMPARGRAAADYVGSTEYIIKTLERRRPGRPGRSAPNSIWSAGWPTAHPDKRIVFLEKTVCYCSTMNRIDLPHLVHSLEALVAGEVVNRISVEPAMAANARLALDRMLALP